MDVDRRTFLKLAGAGIAGVAAEKILYPAGSWVDHQVRDTTGLHTGTAWFREEYQQTCADSTNPRICARDILDSPTEIVINGLNEEVACRTVPYVLARKWDGDRDPLPKALTGHPGITRRELLTGVVSATVFAGAHNLTKRGFDTGIIPASQFLSGLAYWGLQSQFGIIANSTAHILYNLRLRSSLV